jgi:tyrosyl-tRNA synthetase
MSDKEAFALTCPLLTKADGTKFGKSESGNIWLDKDKTSVYNFFQFWINISDLDAERFIKIFTFLDKETIDNLIEEHNKSKHLFLLQKTLAKEITIMVHGVEEFEKANFASNILFSKDDLSLLDEQTFVDVFSDVLKAKVILDGGTSMIEALSGTSFVKSNGEARRALNGNSVSVNKVKVKEDYIITKSDLIHDKFVVLQIGKKNFFLIESI